MRITRADFAKASSGTYTGNGTDNRGIPHGLGKTPKLVIINRNNGQYFNRIFSQLGAIYYVSASYTGYKTVTIMDATNFYVGNSLNYEQSANDTDDVYYWVAIG